MHYSLYVFHLLIFLSLFKFFVNNILFNYKLPITVSVCAVWCWCLFIGAHRRPGTMACILPYPQLLLITSLKLKHLWVSINIYSECKMRDKQIAYTQCQNTLHPKPHTIHAINLKTHTHDLSRPLVKLYSHPHDVCFRRNICLWVFFMLINVF